MGKKAVKNKLVWARIKIPKITHKFICTHATYQLNALKAFSLCQISWLIKTPLIVRLVRMSVFTCVNTVTLSSCEAEISNSTLYGTRAKISGNLSVWGMNVSVATNALQTKTNFRRMLYLM